MSGELGVAMMGEDAAIYAYGLIGVRFTAPGDIAEARSAEQAHRSRRDALISRMDAINASAPPAPAAYDLPFPVVDRPSALKLAIHVEDGVARSWRPVLAATDGDDRATALAALTDSAVRATRWRRLAAVTPVTMPFPGSPA